MTVQKRPSLSLPQIEAVRVAAMAAIFLFHFWSVAPNAIASDPARTVLSYGYLGVVVFNIVTGLVLALPYLGPEGREAPTYGDFMRRRFLRICPNYYLALLIWTPAAVIAAGGLNGLLAASFGAHLLFVHTLSPSTFFTIVPAYWWLGLLAQFYLLFPLLIRLYALMGPGRTTLLLCAACWSVWGALALAAAGNDSFVAMVNYLVYFNLPARLPEFAIGMWLAASWRPPEVGDGLGGQLPRDPAIPMTPGLSLFVLGALVFGLVGSLLLPRLDMPLLHIHQVAWCLVAFFVLVHPAATSRIGATAVVARLGTASYSFYLMHQPVLDYGAAWLKNRSGGEIGPRAGMLFLIVSLAASVALALLLDRLAGLVGGGRKKVPRLVA